MLTYSTHQPLPGSTKHLTMRLFTHPLTHTIRALYYILALNKRKAVSVQIKLIVVILYKALSFLYNQIAIGIRREL